MNLRDPTSCSFPFGLYPDLKSHETNRVRTRNDNYYFQIVGVNVETYRGLQGSVGGVRKGVHCLLSLLGVEPERQAGEPTRSPSDRGNHERS